MRVQLALNVDDLETAIDFYSKAFDTEVAKRRPGYANFEIESPPLKLVLFENPGVDDRLNHLGVEVFDDADVETAAGRFASAGIEHRIEEERVCCYAPQNKVITHDPDGTMFEWYRVLGDSKTFFGEDGGAAREVPANTPSTNAAPKSCCAGGC